MAGDFPSTLSDYVGDYRLSSDFRLSDYDQRLSRSDVSDFGWRLSDYDRPPSFRVEVRRFSDLLTGWRVLPVSWCPGVLVSWCPGEYGLNIFPAVIMYSCPFTKNLDFLLRLRLTSKCKCAILYLPKGSKRKLNFERGSQYEKVP